MKDPRLIKSVFTRFLAILLILPVLFASACERTPAETENGADSVSESATVPEETTEAETGP